MSLILTLLREALDADRTAAGDTQRKLDLILERQDQMSKQLDDLAAQVAANDSAMAAAEALMMGLHDQIVAAGTDAAKLDALTADLSANASKLAASVAANTPAAASPAPADASVSTTTTAV
jgi:peptidoglycan hydrolase CwlO-like protein